MTEPQQASATPPIPVLCDLCRVTGQAGEHPFTHLADLLSFTPVPRRAHANGWSPEVQRAFIAALVVTGSPRRAARAIGRHAFGAEQLKKARGGMSFAAAWDAALDLARERELAGLREGLTLLAAENEEERHARRSAILPASQRALPSPSPLEGEGRGEGEGMSDAETQEAHYREADAARARIRDRMMNARRLYLSMIADHPEKRAAWETLVGPTDWGKAESFEPQDDEPNGDQHVSMRGPDMLLCAQAGLLPDAIGGHDALAGVRAALKLPSREREGLGEGMSDGEDDPDNDDLDENAEDFADRAMRHALRAARAAHPEDFDD